MRLLRQKTLLYTTIALLLLGLVAIHSAHFSGRDYRQDEAWVVHHAMVLTEEYGLAGHLLGVFSRVTPENFVLDSWVNFFGHVEPITRYLSTLYTVLGLAMLFRLAADLFDRWTGLLAVLLMGSLSFFEFFAHEARPYSALVFGAVGFQLAFLRYLRHERPKYALWTLFFGAVALYQHSFMVFVIGAQALFFLLFVAWKRGLFLRVFGLLILLGLIYLPRYLAVSGAANYSGGLGYGIPTNDEKLGEALQILYDWMFMRPESIGHLLLLAGILIPARRLFAGQPNPAYRLPVEWRKIFAIFIPLVMLIAVILLNNSTRILTPRNMIILVPPLALLAAFALRNFPLPAQAVALLLILLPFINDFQPKMGNGSYLQMSEMVTQQFDAQNGRLAVMAGLLWEHVPITYYLHERTPFGLENGDILHLVGDQEEHFQTIPEPPEKVIWDDSAESRQAFLDFMEDYSKLWLIQGIEMYYTQDFLAFIESHFALHRFEQMRGELPLAVAEYRRIPDDLRDVFRFGDEIALRQWQMLNDHTLAPCQTVSLESWWQVDSVPKRNYSMTAVIADASGNGIAKSDGAPGDLLMQLWRPDRPYVDERSITVPCDTAPGEYVLLLGVYDFDTLDKLPVSDASGAALGSPTYLTTIFIR